MTEGIAITKYINPFTDFGFKKLFGEEDSKVYLVDFLNSILESQLATPIVIIENKKTEMLGRASTDRHAVFDLYCITANGDRIIVELQKARQEFFRERALYYSTFAISEQAKKGKSELDEVWNFALTPVYFVGILGFDFSSKDKYLHIGKIQDVEDNDNLINTMTFAFIEMKKFAKSIENCKTKQDKWLYTLHNLAFLHEMPEQLGEQVFLDFFHKAEVGALQAEELGAYYDSIRYARDFHILESENLARGKVEGKAEGEYQAKINMAKKMLIKKVPIAEIVEFTELTIEEIQKI
jgi:predicted transposase/invertase (TIGR01784 family)